LNSIALFPGLLQWPGNEAKMVFIAGLGLGPSLSIGGQLLV